MGRKCQFFWDSFKKSKNPKNGVKSSTLQKWTFLWKFQHKKFSRKKVRALFLQQSSKKLKFKKCPFLAKITRKIVFLCDFLRSIFQEINFRVPYNTKNVVYIWKFYKNQFLEAYHVILEFFRPEICSWGPRLAYL